MIIDVVSCICLKESITIHIGYIDLVIDVIFNGITELKDLVSKYQHELCQTCKRCVILALVVFG